MKASLGNTSSTVEADAARWAAALDAQPDTPLPDLDTWLAQDPRHAGALLRAQAVLAMFAPTAPVAAQAANAPVAAQAATTPVAAQAPVRRRWRWPALGGVAGLAAGIAGLLLYDFDAQTYATDVGELRQVTLAEGSSLALDTQTTLRVDMDRDARVVRLDQGRALMRVRHDAARPFLVRAGDVTITDIGTVFQVIRRDEAVTVLVSEGQVEVKAPTGTMRLSAGQMASFGPQAAGARTIPASAVERAMAWTSGRIDLDGERLDTAIDDMNRHNRLKITLADPALGREKLYGAFRLDDPLGFARTAAISVGAHAQDQGEAITIAK